MTVYAIPGAPLQFAPRVTKAAPNPRGPLSTAAVNVPLLAVLLAVIVVLCLAGVLVSVARHAVHHGTA